MANSTRQYLRIAGAVLVALGTIAVASEFRYCLLLRKFAVVEAGSVYRGGRQRPGPLRRLIRTYGIRSILCLAEPDPREQRIAQEMGVAWYCIPLEDATAPSSVPLLERAAAILADPASYPVFFHCEHGRNRSNMVQAIYRMKHCGWNVVQALEELSPTGYNPEQDPGDRARGCWLERYYGTLELAENRPRPVQR